MCDKRNPPYLLTIPDRIPGLCCGQYKSPLLTRFRWFFEAPGQKRPVERKKNRLVCSRLPRSFLNYKSRSRRTGIDGRSDFLRPPSVFIELVWISGLLGNPSAPPHKLFKVHSSNKMPWILPSFFFSKNKLLNGVFFTVCYCFRVQILKKRTNQMTINKSVS